MSIILNGSTGITTPATFTIDKIPVKPVPPVTPAQQEATISTLKTINIIHPSGTVNNIVNDSSGNVGIGTSSPSYPLVVSKNQNAATVFQLVNNNTGASAASILQSQIGASSYVNYSTFAAYNQIVGSGITTQYIDFDTQIFRTTGGSERMRIDSSGNVGIGTSSPSTYGGTYKKVLSIGLTDQNLTLGAYYQSGIGQYSFINSSTGTASSAADLVFQAGSSETMRIDASGNVGIGATANASAILDAQSTTKGVRFPNMTTTQKNAVSSPAAGLVVFDTTLAKLCVYSGSAWQTITSI